ncbi:MAG: 4'-phosphopantetheinyl transferase superfamily protein [Bacteroidetes bacterium]|nr:4'-phosphopantetheinyl transferase superfamily protein [Bacteroidota bacterium]
MIKLKKINAFIAIGILDLHAFAKNRLDMPKRELEKAGSQFLLKQMLKTEIFEINYTAENKPFLKARTEHISISHSHDKLAIIINENENTGIDIELVRDKVLKIQHKFLNAAEVVFVKDNVEKLITIWAAKEAMYKAYGLKELDFKTNLFVEKFDSSVIFGKIEIGDLKKRFELRLENIDDYKMVYILNEL